MVTTYTELTPEALTPLGFDDPTRAAYLLREMAGHDVPDSVFDALLAALLPVLADSADPDRAVTNLGRWADAVPHRISAYSQLATQPIAAQILITIFAASQFFADLVIHTPEYLEVLVNPTIRDRGRDFASYRADIARRLAAAPPTPNAKRDALRRFKPPEILRIGARDLLGYADMLRTAREISDFADACVTASLEICVQERHLQELSFAVIAMGKLGGRELNYASDIDLIFIHGNDADARAAIALGEAVRDTLARVTDAGFLFRVDLRLRPEGRFGAISRSLESCRAYYESWAEPWERQALLKARPVAGDPALGQAFLEMVDAYVYRPHVEEAFVQSIQANKRRMEQKIAGERTEAINVKEGIGGIRDIEFIVQLLQLIAGGRFPELRTGNTLEALPRLAAQGLLREPEQKMLSEDYQFLRTVEHRLQILDERPIRALPTDPDLLKKFGRRLGYPDGAAFLQDYRRRTERVHTLFQQLFYGPPQAPARAEESDEWLQWIQAPEEEAARLALRKALQEAGFQQIALLIPLFRRALMGSEYGQISPEGQETLLALLPALIQACAATSAPDSALRGLLGLADSVPSRAALFRSLQEQPQFLSRLCTLAAESAFLWQILITHLEYLDLLADDAALEALPDLTKARDLNALGPALRRARLQTQARDLWGQLTTVQVMSEVTRTAEGALASALDIACRESGFSGRIVLIGFGKLGGSELGYSSDLDVVFAADPEHLRAAGAVAEGVQRLLGSRLSSFGLSYEVDPRLRPEGQKGALALDLESYRHYYAASAALWERHALLKARPITGDSALGQAFTRMANEVVFGQPWTPEELGAVRAMKQRIETERLRDPNDLKLAPGGLMDIEWTVQFLQLQWGHIRPRLRASSTLKALLELRDDVRITQAEWETLSETYLTLTRLRNHLFLRQGIATDLLPEMPDFLRAKMTAVRHIAEKRFYGA